MEYETNFFGCDHGEIKYEGLDTRCTKCGAVQYYDSTDDVHRWAIPAEQVAQSQDECDECDADGAPNVCFVPIPIDVIDEFAKTHDVSIARRESIQLFIYWFNEWFDTNYKSEEKPCIAQPQL
jgi:hypothetical protein